MGLFRLKKTAAANAIWTGKTAAETSEVCPSPNL